VQTACALFSAPELVDPRVFLSETSSCTIALDERTNHDELFLTGIGFPASQCQVKISRPPFIHSVTGNLPQVVGTQATEVVSAPPLGRSWVMNRRSNGVDGSPTRFHHHPGAPRKHTTPTIAVRARIKTPGRLSHETRGLGWIPAS